MSKNENADIAWRETQATGRVCFVSRTVRYSVVPGIGGECTHLSSFGRTGRQGGGGESIREGWEVPVLQSSGLGGI